MTPSPDEQTTDRLLACPFCGNLPSVIEENNVVCQTRFCPMEFYEIKLTMWNRRTPAQAADVDKVLAEQQAEIERLQESYSRLLVKAAETEQQRDDFWQRLHSLIEAIPPTGHHSTLGNQMRAAIEWIRKSQSLTASLERVKELEKENEQRRDLIGWVMQKIRVCHPDIGTDDKLPEWMYCAMNVLSSRAKMYENYLATRKNDVAELEDKVATLTEQVQSLTLARAEAKVLAYEECRQTVAQVFDDYRHLIQREFNEKYGGVDNLSGENFLGDAVDFAIRKIEAEGGSPGE